MRTMRLEGRTTHPRRQLLLGASTVGLHELLVSGDVLTTAVEHEHECPACHQVRECNGDTCEMQRSKVCWQCRLKS